MNKGCHLLVIDEKRTLALQPSYAGEIASLRTHFCGSVLEMIPPSHNFTHIYLTGDLASCNLSNANGAQLFAIDELTMTSDVNVSIVRVTLGQVPINVHDVGVFYPQLFPMDKDYFSLLSQEHQFQELTESNKPKGRSLRKGLYLTHVSQRDDDETHFHLLRCSTNLDGPTENFRNVDHSILNAVSLASQPFFPDSAPFNHVLAQIYENKRYA